MLDTIREYALDRLRDGGGRTEAHDRHASYYLALAKEDNGADDWPGAFEPEGPVAPAQYRNLPDIDEIIEQHLQHGRVAPAAGGAEHA